MNNEHHEYRDLDCALTDKEVADYERQLPVLVGSYKDIETEKQDTTRRLGARLKALRADIDNTAEKVRTRKEKRNVRCFIQFDVEVRKANIIREDTLEVVDTRDMKPSEVDAAQQTRIRFDEASVRRMLEDSSAPIPNEDAEPPSDKS